MANRRAMHRKLLRGPAQMTQGSASMAVRTWDLGPDGMCLVSPRPIEPGTRIVPEEVARSMKLVVFKITRGMCIIHTPL